MTNLAASILETFPYDTIDQTHLIGSVPTFATIEASVQQLHANAASIQSLQGNGKTGHIVLTIGATAYTAQAPNKIAFVVPPNPGTSPTISAGATAANIGELREKCNEDRLLYETYMQTDDALKKLLIVATDKDYLKTLNHPTYGLSEHTTFDLINHLYDTYGTITNEQLRDNETKMDADFYCYHPAYNSVELSKYAKTNDEITIWLNLKLICQNNTCRHKARLPPILSTST